MNYDIQNFIILHKKDAFFKKILQSFNIELGIRPFLWRRRSYRQSCIENIGSFFTVADLRTVVRVNHFASEGLSLV